MGGVGNSARSPLTMASMEGMYERKLDPFLRKELVGRIHYVVECFARDLMVVRQTS